MNGRAIRRSSATPAAWRFVCAILSSLFWLSSLPERARAQPSSILAAGGAWDSATATVAPNILLSLSMSDADQLDVSQAGWTTSVGYQHKTGPERTLLATFRATPYRAYLSNIAFQDGTRTEAGTFDAAELQVEAGTRVEPSTPCYAELAVKALRTFVSGLDANTVQRWNRLQLGSELRAGAKWLRARDPLRARFDGLWIRAKARGFIGSTPWFDVRASLQAGRRVRRVFVSGSISFAHVAAADRVSRIPVGGSWDILGAQALYGFPLSAYRLASYATANARVDLRLIGNLELGLRSTGLVHARGIAHGGAVQLAARLSGIDVTAGVGSAGPEPFGLNAFVLTQAAWLL